MKTPLSNILFRISPDETQQGNIWRTARTGMLTTANATLVAVPIIQVFVLYLGGNETQLGGVRFFSQLALVLGFAAYTKRAGLLPQGRLPAAYTRLHLYQALLPAAALAVALWALWGTVPLGAALVLLTLGWMASNFFMSYYYMVMARVEALLFSPGIYGAVYGFCGILFYGVSTVLGAVINPLLGGGLSHLGYPLVFCAAFALGACSFLSARGYVLAGAPPADAPRAPAARPRALAADGQTLKIGAIHVLRGVISGIYYFIVPIGLSHYGLLSSDIGLLTILSTLSAVVAYLFILRATDRFGVVRSCLLAEILGVLSLLALAAAPGRAVFMATYFVYGIGAAILNQVLPIGVLRSVPQQRLATVTAVRLVAIQLADAVTSLGLGPVIIPFHLLFLLLACLLKAAKYILIRQTFGENSGKSRR